MSSGRRRDSRHMGFPPPTVARTDLKTHIVEDAEVFKAVIMAIARITIVRTTGYGGNQNSYVPPPPGNYQGQGYRDRRDDGC